MENLGSKAVGGLIWQVVNFGVKAVLNIAFIMIVSRLIAKEEFGIYAIATVIMIFVNLFSEVGIGSALVHEEDHSNKSIQTAFTLSLCLSTIVYVILYTLAPTISSFYDDRISSLLIRIIGLSAFFLNISVVSYSLLIRHFKFKQIAVASLTSFIIGNLIVTLFLAWKGYGVWALVIGFTVKNFFNLLILYFFSPHSIRFILHKERLSFFLHYGSGLTLVRLLRTISVQIDKILFSKLIPIYQLGLYERSQTIIKLPIDFMGSTLDGVFFSTLSRIRTEKERLKNTFLTSLSVISMVTAIVGFYCIFFPEAIVTIFLGKNWLDASVIVQLLGVTIFTTIYARFVDTLVRATNKMFKSSLIKFIAMIIQILAIVLGLRFGDFYLCVVFIMVSQIIYGLMMIGLALRILEVKALRFFLSQLATVRVVSLLIFLYVVMMLFNSGVMTGFLLSVIVSPLALLLVFFYTPLFYGNSNLILISKMINALPVQFSLISKMQKHIDSNTR